jgi:hypothetical protein
MSVTLGLVPGVHGTATDPIRKTQWIWTLDPRHEAEDDGSVWSAGTTPGSRALLRARRCTMLKNLLGAFIGAKVEEKSGKPLLGAAAGATAVAIAKRSLPLAIALAAVGAGIAGYMAYRRNQAFIPLT